MKKAQEKTKDFKFKKFHIHGGFSGMPVSTDGVLLGAWFDAGQDDAILDIGTGTGLLSLMAAQRFPLARITAIEIDPQAFQAASHNFQQSDWAGRLDVIQGDILHWEGSALFDTIICNPPYFNSGEQSHSSQRATARHTGSLSHKELLLRCKKLLAPAGKASFVLPQFEGSQFIQMAQSCGYYLSRLCEVSPNEKKPVHRLLIELSQQEGLCEGSKLAIMGESGYSPAFISLTNAFYLKM